MPLSIDSIDTDIAGRYPDCIFFITFFLFWNQMYINKEIDEPLEVIWKECYYESSEKNEEDLANIFKT